ncbi:hypothetical protein FK513_29890, partial [Klebsiella pneumoniae]|nr:hypothetical protein [Klebsiella pneumoniae]
MLVLARELTKTWESIHGAPIGELVSAPLISKMPVGATMIATDVASPFFTPIKLTFMVSVILSPIPAR